MHTRVAAAAELFLDSSLLPRLLQSLQLLQGMHPIRRVIGAHVETEGTAPLTPEPRRVASRRPRPFARLSFQDRGLLP
eukprot:4277401-Prymnesium_polylepis.1